MSDRKWHVACPFINRFEECRELSRRNGFVTVRVDGVTEDIPQAEYNAAFGLHALKHAEQKAKFQAAAAAPWLGEAVFWWTYIRGYFKHGAFRNPLELEARQAEERKP